MRVVNIHEAKTHLSRLVEAAVNGEDFIIARAGKPLVKVTALEPPKRGPRLGFLIGQPVPPDDFDRLDEEEIRKLFEGDDEQA
jgi:prevent-host-death family protein